MEQKAAVLAGYVADRLQQGRTDLLPLSYAFALTGAVQAAAVVFGHSSGQRALSDLVAEAVTPVYRGYQQVLAGDA